MQTSSTPPAASPAVQRLDESPEALAKGDPTLALQAAIAQHRSAVAARRARAFVDCPDTVLGLSLRPLTPRSWTLLHAIGSRLLTGEQPLEGDVRNYLWFHSLLFPLASRLPAPGSRLLKWLSLLPFSAVLHRRRDVDWYAATLAVAIHEVHGLLADALADAPQSDRACAPGPCLEAQFIHFAAATYGWPPARTRATPLRQLMQLVRAAHPADDDEQERQIRFAHLRQRNAELQASKNP